MVRKEIWAYVSHLMDHHRDYTINKLLQVYPGDGANIVNYFNHHADERAGEDGADLNHMFNANGLFFG